MYRDDRKSDSSLSVCAACTKQLVKSSQFYVYIAHYHKAHISFSLYSIQHPLSLEPMIIQYSVDPLKTVLASTDMRKILMSTFTDLPIIRPFHCMYMQMAFPRDVSILYEDIRDQILKGKVLIWCSELIQLCHKLVS